MLPGSLDAKDSGCNCPNNNNGFGIKWEEKRKYHIIDNNCSIHGIEAKGNMTDKWIQLQKQRQLKELQ